MHCCLGAEVRSVWRLGRASHGATRGHVRPCSPAQPSAAHSVRSVHSITHRAKGLAASRRISAARASASCRCASPPPQASAASSSYSAFFRAAAAAA